MDSLQSGGVRSEALLSCLAVGWLVPQCETFFMSRDVHSYKAGSQVEQEKGQQQGWEPQPLRLSPSWSKEVSTPSEGLLSQWTQKSWVYCTQWCLGR